MFCDTVEKRVVLSDGRTEGPPYVLAMFGQKESFLTESLLFGRWGIVAVVAEVGVKISVYCFDVFFVCSLVRQWCSFMKAVTGNFLAFLEWIDIFYMKKEASLVGCFEKDDGCYNELSSKMSWILSIQSLEESDSSADWRLSLPASQIVKVTTTRIIILTDISQFDLHRKMNRTTRNDVISIFFDDKM